MRSVAQDWQDTRGDQVDQERIEEAPHQQRPTKDRWGSPGRKQTWQLLTDSYTDGVEVWPNVSSWMRDESRFKVSQLSYLLVVPELFEVFSLKNSISAKKLKTKAGVGSGEVFLVSSF